MQDRETDAAKRPRGRDLAPSQAFWAHPYLTIQLLFLLLLCRCRCHSATAAAPSAPPAAATSTRLPPPPRAKMAAPPPDRTAVLAAVERASAAALAGNDGSHSYDHAARVRANALRLAALEGLGPDSAYVIELAALLHDVADWKYAPNGAAAGASAEAAVKALLPPLGIDAATVERVVDVIARVGFKDELPSADGGGGPLPELSIEAKVVQDADRLDAIGAIGIARCFTFGGRFDRPLYDPADLEPLRAPSASDGDGGARTASDGASPAPAPVAAAALTREQYMAQHAGGRPGAAGRATVGHFHDKLLRLPGMMKTAGGRRLAEGRHAFMVQFLQQLAREVDGQV
ncbi:hypothetical protein Rsub_04663 [Raphidocelis subcapitata]|uniref:HD/PDEase domain-containing protein n=1 Tax=Raphidocelis subcapitata TaxID=307507 RepID=A0A2V0NX71_9CHLO|nr:hypothetical protein Rsub_04663 [Raphidocelis subcapitata]|eukprot:GBF91939.1 hypothetical protein Rsub_04663 [Raphidocelis subcapitata]